MKIKRKRLSTIALMALWAVSLCAWPALAQDEGPKVLKMATGPAVCIDFAAGRGIATMWSMSLAESDKLQCQALVSPGSEQNLSSLRLKKVDLAILENLIANTAWEGTALYQGSPYKEMRALFRIWPNVEYFIVRGENYKTGTIADLAGQAVSAGMPGSGEFSALVILQAVGINRSEMQLRYLLPYKAYRDFQARKVTGLMLSDGPVSYPLKYVFKDKANKPRLLEVSDKQLEAINSKSPYNGFKFTVEADRYPNLEKNVNTIAQFNHLYCRTDLDEKTAYTLTKVFFEQFGQWGNLDFSKAQLEDPKQAMKGLVVPLHLGAYRYFKENKIAVPESLIPPEARQPAPAAQQQEGQ